MVINLEAEHALLGCILTDGELIKETTLQDKHFLDGANQILFKTFREIEQKGELIDLVAVVTTMDPRDLSRMGGKPYLSKLMNSVASLESFKIYEKYIYNAWKVSEAQKIQQNEIHSLDDLSHTMSELANLELESNESDYDHAASLEKLFQDIEQQEKGLSGLDTGFKDLNNFLDGFQNGDLIISAARPSVGKTAKMINHAIHHCEAGGLTAIFSLEMGEQLLNKRMISTIGRIDGYKMKNPKQFFDSKDWSRFNTALGELSNMNIHIYDNSGQTVEYIRSKVKQLRRQYPDVPMLVQIDYLQLMRSSKKFETKTIEVGEITRSLKELAKDEQVPVYLLSQLSRGVESRQDKRPMMSDIRDSGSVEQDADVIEFLYRDDYYNAETEKQNIIEVIIAKQRNGPVGTVELAFLKEYNLFLDLEVRH